jgi:hypothetical protein
MDAERFDALTLALTGAACSRRRLLRGAAGSSLAMLAAALGVPKVGATHVGCKHVGTRCTKSGQCCSGRCRHNRCKAHDVGTCTATQNFCTSSTATCGAGGTSCGCTRTTGGASFCAQNGTQTTCTTDRECVEALGSPGAACVDFTGCTPGGSRCAIPCTT